MLKGKPLSMFLVEGRPLLDDLVLDRPTAKLKIHLDDANQGFFFYNSLIVIVIFLLVLWLTRVLLCAEVLDKMYAPFRPYGRISDVSIDEKSKLAFVTFLNKNAVSGADDYQRSLHFGFDWSIDGLGLNWVWIGFKLGWIGFELGLQAISAKNCLHQTYIQGVGRVMIRYDQTFSPLRLSNMHLLTATRWLRSIDVIISQFMCYR